MTCDNGNKTLLSWDEGETDRQADTHTHRVTRTSSFLVPHTAIVNGGFSDKQYKIAPFLELIDRKALYIIKDT